MDTVFASQLTKQFHVCVCTALQCLWYIKHVLLFNNLKYKEDPHQSFWYMLRGKEHIFLIHLLLLQLNKQI